MNVSAKICFWCDRPSFRGVVVAGCRILPSVVVSVFAGLSFLLVIWLDVYD
ncbi:hypothetical protein [Rhodococcus sp. DMU1]|uniref:hypothetical protein n=1 Tax=Rhodococcus sp. DMU1 TaxID=2722825 RepID=UPI00143E8D75|nr:hypothetical protein [Rhodococcus sp. DMU1]QIX48695.1 hypothetical protein HFP48_03430 [Rhodococcus sp. DMU1]